MKNLDSTAAGLAESIATTCALESAISASRSYAESLRLLFHRALAPVAAMSVRSAYARALADTEDLLCELTREGEAEVVAPEEPGPAPAIGTVPGDSEIFAKGRIA